MVFIYILQLELNKYYIGKTNNSDIRLDSHFNSNGSEWTKIYKPIKVYELISDCDSYDEDKYTLKYMEKEGIDNVRGGSFSQIELSDEQIKLINQMIKGASDKCFNCGESDHFIKDCIKSRIQDYLKDLNNENIKNEIIKINSIYEEIVELNRLIKLTDFICIDDLPKIKKISQDMKKLNKLQEEDRKINLKRKEEEYHYSHNSRVRLDKKLHSISDQINKLETYFFRNGGCLRDQIYSLYRKINPDIVDARTRKEGEAVEPKDIVILGLELIKFNLEKKKRLKEIFEEYYSEDFIKKLLSKLYEKEIEIIESQIS